MCYDRSSDGIIDGIFSDTDGGELFFREHPSVIEKSINKISSMFL